MLTDATEGHAMSDSSLPFRTATVAPPVPAGPRADLGYVSTTFFTRLRDTLRAARRLLDACTAARSADVRRAGGWGVPAQFFFDRAAEAERAARRPVAPAFPEPYRTRLTASHPTEAAAWDRLPRLLDDALTLLPASVDARRAARAVDGLLAAAQAFAAVLPAADELVGLLTVADEEVVLAVHPAARVGVRVLLRGVADVYQLHVLLADAMAGDPARGLLPGRRPDPRVVDAYRDAEPHPAAAETPARFQLFHPAGLLPDGTLPAGFTGTDHWYWGPESPTALPRENGERVVVLGEPVYAGTWAVRRRYRRLPGEADRLEVLSRADVDRWLTARCPRLAHRPAVGRVAA
jgi:hypothetical protein